jgi:NAD(P)-dependent dehydrogenase (short-subunit alcohol dehydrogenase family)
VRLAGKVAIVTGAGGGIGRAIAIGYAREGAAVVVDDRLLSAAESTVSDIQATGGRAVAVSVDVSNLDAHEALIAAALNEFGTLNILVNNAGVEFHEPVLEASPEIWEKTLGVNLKGAYFLSCKAAPLMARFGGGKIIHISSIHDVEPLRDRAIYSISKAGVMMLVKSLALELAEFKIHVNAISPGAILTDMNRIGLSDPLEFTKLLEQIPIKRIGEPEDIVGAAVFLASSESDYVTGTTIYVDGGLLLL